MFDPARTRAAYLPRTNPFGKSEAGQHQPRVGITGRVQLANLAAQSGRLLYDLPHWVPRCPNALAPSAHQLSGFSRRFNRFKFP